MTLKEIISESKNVDLTSFGFERQSEPVVDGHISYLSERGANEIILVDVPAKEWHYMQDGVVVKVGSTMDNSLKKFLATSE